MQERLYCTTNLFNVAHQTSVNGCISLLERLQRNNSSKTDLTQVSNEKKSKCVYSSIMGSKTKKKKQKQNNPHHQSIKPCKFSKDPFTKQPKYRERKEKMLSFIHQAQENGKKKKDIASPTSLDGSSSLPQPLKNSNLHSSSLFLLLF